MRILTPETDTGGRTDKYADFPGAVLEVLAAREGMLNSAEQSARPLGAMVAASTMPPDVLREFSVGTKT
ncbi:MAG: hypothetical protein WAW63_05125 [Candidatus Saccharimonadales bacterium]|jgi:hypothetical protein|nr:hypothetical protein [Candidatus Saccharibacteria bacterium]